MSIRRVVIAGLIGAACCQAGSIDLSTLPPRQSVQLTIYNAEDLTLVREVRSVTFKAGENQLQFSWINTEIDPTSVQIEFPRGESRLELIDTIYPHNKPKFLYWTVQATEDLESRVEITYFTSGLSWSADYSFIASPDESTMDVTGFVRVF